MESISYLEKWTAVNEARIYSMVSLNWAFLQCSFQYAIKREIIQINGFDYMASYNYVFLRCV